MYQFFSALTTSILVSLVPSRSLELGGKRLVPLGSLRAHVFNFPTFRENRYILVLRDVIRYLHYTSVDIDLADGYAGLIPKLTSTMVVALRNCQFTGALLSLEGMCSRKRCLFTRDV